MKQFNLKPLYSKIGQQKNFKRALQEIMKKYPAEMFRQSIKQARGERKANPNLPDIDPSLWNNLYNEIDMALRDAKKTAEFTLSTYPDVRNREGLKMQDEYAQTRGEVYAPILENK